MLHLLKSAAAIGAIKQKEKLIFLFCDLFYIKGFSQCWSILWYIGYMFKIRSPQLNDFASLAELLKDNAFLENLNKNKLLYITQPLIPPNLRPVPSIHIAQEEKNIIGFVILQCTSKQNNCWQINDVFVTNEMRNKGVGEELLRYVLSVYGGHGIEHFLAEVDAQNFPALSLFHQCGFRRYAKVCFYEKEIDVKAMNVKAIHELPLLDKDFILRQQIQSDLLEIEKLELSSIPPDLRPALGRSKGYFKEKKNANVLIDKSRNLVIGWAQVQKISNDSYFIELIASPGWTHLYEQFLNTIICDCIAVETEKIKLTVKVIDYLTELAEILSKSGFLKVEVKELLVRTIWQKAKERKTKAAKIGAPYTAPT